MATIAEALAIGLRHHEAGRLELAEQVYRQILAVEPDQPDAIHLLGVIARQSGRNDLAVEHLRHAIRLHGTEPLFHYHLGVVLQAQGKLDEAVAAYQEALRLRPDYAEAYNNLGDAWRVQSKLDQAAAAFQNAVELSPELVEAHYNLGNVLGDLGQWDRAVAAYQRALQLRPDYAEALNNMGLVLQAQGRLDESIAALQQASRLRPDCAEAHNNLGVVLRDQGRLDEAAVALQNALRLRPDYAEACNSLGLVLQDQGKLDEAVAAYQRALHLKPDYAEAHNSLGNAWKDQGRLDEAMAAYQEALRINPGYATAHSNLLYAFYFHPDYNARMIFEEHRRWNAQQANRLAPAGATHPNERSPERRLRVGYVSPDFRWHPVGRFFLPLLETHDRQAFEIFCYSCVRVPDSVTDRCRAQADVWRDVLGLSDERLADTIRQDGIDILVDLTMHMADNRILVFARKPAPVQATYLAYCGTTGLDTMDYRLTDPYLDPIREGGTAEGGCATQDSIYSERSIRLPETYWCYAAPSDSPPCNRVPALPTGHVTFGCLNNFCKVTPATLAAWRRLLQALPEARLLMHAHAGEHRDRVRDFFAQGGVSPRRLTFVAAYPPAEYFPLYDRMDIALDPFPYGGGATTCDALWMGVPVVSLAGDLPRLAELRSTLRARMQSSPLMDAPRFARNIEAAYRTMWQQWCDE